MQNKMLAEKKQPTPRQRREARERFEQKMRAHLRGLDARRGGDENESESESRAALASLGRSKELHMSREP